MSGLKSKIRAMFDILPAVSREAFVLSEDRSSEDLNLREVSGPTKEPEPPKPADDESFRRVLDQVLLEGDLRQDIALEVEAIMSGEKDHLAELANSGASFPSANLATKVAEPILVSKNDLNLSLGNYQIAAKLRESLAPDYYQGIIDRIREPVSSRTAKLVSSYNSETDKKDFPISSKENIKPRAAFIKSEFIVDEPNLVKTTSEEIASFYNPPAVLPKTALLKNIPKRHLNFISPGKKKKTGWWLIILIISGMGVYGLVLKNEISHSGLMAFDSLQQAGDSLKSFNFNKAADNFGKSYEDFAKMSQTMNFMGAGLAGIFGDLPVLGKIKSAKDITEAGKLIAESGKAMSQAMASLAYTGSILDPSSSSSGPPDKGKMKPLQIINQIQSALALSSANFEKAKALLAEIDESVIPEDKRQKLHDFKDKLPLLEEYLGNAVEYSDFLEGFVGIDKPRKYLILFQNNSELRPTGGFPGTYGVVSFASGGLSDFFVNDVYNLDGQLKRNIIPPKPLQHITPTWGMRDSAWFIDLPLSAKKAMSFFTQEAGYGVNGVITLNPDIISKIMNEVGPIKMPEYDMTLTADNFLSSIQEEVEYGPNRTQPKQVIVDFAPRFLEKLYSADSAKWMRIFNILMDGLEEKDIQFYFDDRMMENFTIRQGFGGEIKDTSGDYLNVNFTNVKGSKTDAVTDSYLADEVKFEDGHAVHHLKVTRNHRGGDKEHGFYNRQNPTYVRILLPEDAELNDIRGNDKTSYRPLINYSSIFGFESDADLKKLESSFFKDDRFVGVEKYYESGKKGIAFWMVVEPGTSKTVELEYSVPFSGDEYNLYFQKQSGVDWRNFNFKLYPPSDRDILSAGPGLNRIGDVVAFDNELRRDLDFKVSFK